MKIYSVFIIFFSLFLNQVHAQDCEDNITQTITPLEVCDNDFDDEVFIDLTEKRTEAIEAITNTATSNITYHNTEQDAETGDAPIEVPTEVILPVADLPEDYFIRIIDTDACVNIVSFQVNFNNPPSINTPTAIEACSRTPLVNLTTRDNQITGGNPNLTVSYHRSFNGAIAGDNSIPNPSSFNVNTAFTVFVRVLDVNTGCINTTTLTVRALNGPTVTPGNLFLNACSATNSTESTFNLNDIVPFAISGSTAGIDIFFYESSGNATNDVDRIPNPSNYTSNRSRDIFIRAVNRSTGCFNIVAFQIHPNLLLSNRINRAQFNACDISNDNEDDVFLRDVADHIINDITDISVTFYETEAERDANGAALDPNVPIRIFNTNTTTKFFTRLTYNDPTNNPSCTIPSEIDVLLNDIVTFPAIDDQFVCDVLGDRQDGVSTVRFSDFVNDVRNNTNGFLVSFYLNENDASNRIRFLNNNSPIDFGAGRTLTIYTRIEEQTSGCFSINSFPLTILDGPSIIVPEVVTLSLCDDDNIPDDGKTIIDLELYGLEASLGDITGETVTYHSSLPDAQTGDNALNDNPDINLNAYEATTGEPVFIRLVNDDTMCDAIVRLDVNITLPPTIPNEDLVIGACIDNNNGFHDFNLTEIETNNPTLFSQRNNVNFLYFTTEDDAENRNINETNPSLDNHITRDEALSFRNTSNPQVIYLRVERRDNIGCNIVVPLTLIVSSNPVANEVEPLLACEDTPGSGSATFSLGALVDNIKQNPDDTVTFHLLPNDAQSGENAIELINDANFESTSQTIYARLTNIAGCFDVIEISLNVAPGPQVDDFSFEPVCAIDGLDPDGNTIFDTAEFNLTQIESNGSITYNGPETLLVNYYTNLNGALNQITADEITNPETYQSQTNTVYVRVTTNVANSCVEYGSLELNVRALPQVNNMQTLPICATPNTITNLTNVEQLLTNQTNVNFKYYLNEADANLNNTNNIQDPENFDYSALLNNTIYVTLQYNDNEPFCFTVAQFNLLIDEDTSATQPDTLFACDESDNDETTLFNLTLQNSTILDDLDPSEHSVRYYVNPDDANSQSGNGAIPNDEVESYLSSNTTIYARVQNTASGCFDTTSFDLEVVPFPNQPITLEQCDEDYDGITRFNLTQVSASQLFDSSFDTSNIEISYYATQADFDANNPIPNPNDYEVNPNAPNVIVSAFHNLANCSSEVILNLRVNSPPAIDESLTEFNICATNDGDFDLQAINPSLLQNPNDTNTSVRYYLNNQNALDETLELRDYNYLRDGLEVVARVEFAAAPNGNGCFFIHPLTIVVNEIPDLTPPNDLFACDENANGEAEFNLNQRNDDILAGLDPNQYSVTYYLSQDDADNGPTIVTPLTSPYNSGNVTIFARVETNVDNGLVCYNTTSFSLQVIPTPITPITLEQCDEDYDGITTFNLTQIDANELFDASLIDTSNFTLSYYATQADFDANNPIPNPNNYEVNPNAPNVIVSAFHNLANCSSEVILNLMVNLPPAIDESLTEFNICETADNTFDLQDINSTLLQDTTDASLRYYRTQNDAENENSELVNYNYNTDGRLVFARVEFTAPPNGTGCYFIHPITIVVNQAPIANTVPPIDAECEVSDGEASFRLSDLSSTILGNQDPTIYSVTYHDNEADAQTGLNPLNANGHLAANEAIIYARVAFNSSIQNINCYETTSFSVFVNRKPIIETIEDQALCLENLPLEINASTGFEADTYAWTFDGNPIGDNTSTIVIQSAGEYTVQATSQFGCLSDLITFTISEQQSGVIESIDVDNFKSPNNITVNMTGTGEFLFVLDDGEPQTSNVFTSVAMGFHVVTVIDINGCLIESRQVVVLDYPKFFTPNGDSYNDTWHIAGVTTLPGSVVYVYDRFGKLIKTLTHNSNGWDGTFNGQPLPSTDYWFRAELVDGENTFEVSGHFALER